MSFVSDIANVATSVWATKYNKKQQLAAEEREKAYNHPKAQMERLDEAGLNPNLIYGSGTETGNLNASATTADRPDIKVDPLERMRTNQEIQNLRNQGRATKAQADIAEHDAGVVKSRPGLLSTESAVQGVAKSLVDTGRQALDKVRDKYSEWESSYDKLRSYGHSKWKSAGLLSLW